MKPITKKIIFTTLAVLVILTACIGTASAGNVNKHSIFYQVDRMYYEVKDIPVGQLVQIENYQPEGYNVSEWKSNDVVILNNSFMMPDKNVTLTASVQPKTYNVTLVTNGGNILGSYNAYYHYGETYVLPKTLNKSGDTFLGWYDNPQFTGNRIYQIEAKETGNKTFYAKYKSDEKNTSATTTGNTSTNSSARSPFPIIGIVAGLTVAGIIIARKRG